MKQKKSRITDDVRNVVSEAGKTNFPLPETCKLAGITLEQFAENEELQAVYRLAQIETQLELRKAILKDALQGNGQSVKLFLDKFDQPVLPDLKDMPEEVEEE